MIKLTKDFYDYEFLVSASYPVLASKMILTLTELERFKLLCESILQPLRDKFGLISIESGKRSIELNNIVGGDEDSDHLYSCAADIIPEITIGNRDKLIEVFTYIYLNLPYRQIVIYNNKKIIHISCNIPGRQYKHEAWICKNGVYTLFKLEEYK